VLIVEYDTCESKSLDADSVLGSADGNR
jgi:hypothetical protein